MKAHPLAPLAAGLLVGGVIGYLAGHRPAPPAEVVQRPAEAEADTGLPQPTPDAQLPRTAVPVAPPPRRVEQTDFNTPAMPTLARRGVRSLTKSAGVSEGMPQAGALAVLTAAGFERCADPSAVGPWEKFRKPWAGG